MSSSEGSYFPPGVEIYNSLPSDVVPQEVYAQAYNKCHTGCPPDYYHNYESNYYQNCEPRRKHKHTIRSCSQLEFNTNVSPVTNLISDSGREGTTRIWFRRKNRVVTMQMEGFQAQVSGNGVTSVAVGMSVGDLPVAGTTTLIKIVLRNSAITGTFEADPDQAIKYSIHFSLDDSVTASTGDTLQVPGFTVNWISQSYN